VLVHSLRLEGESIHSCRLTFSPEVDDSKLVELIIDLHRVVASQLQKLVPVSVEGHLKTNEVLLLRSTSAFLTQSGSNQQKI